MKIAKSLGYFCGGLLFLQVLVVLWGIASRALLSQQASWTVEVSRYLLIWISLLGAAYATAERQHIAIHLLPDSLNEKRRIALNRLIDALVACFALGVMVVGGIRLVYITLSLGQRSPALEFQVGYVYLAVPLAGIFILFFLAKDIIHGRS